MAYYFMVESKKGEYKPIDIKKSKYFTPSKINQQTGTYTSQYNKPYACSLQEIDLFTMMFNDEKELRNSLLLEGILPVSLSTKPLSSRNLVKERYNKVMYDFLYQKDMEFIIDPIRVITLIMKRYHQNDFAFIHKLASNFSNHYGCTTTAPEIARLAEDSIRTGRRNPHLDELDENKDKMVARLVKLLIIEHFETKDGRIIYKNGINYRNLHDVIAFINNYDKKTNLDDEQIITKTEPTEIKTIEPSQEQIVTCKKRTKKKHSELEGQLSFTDLI